MTGAAVAPADTALPSPAPALVQPTSSPPIRADSASSALSHGSGTCSECAGGCSGSGPHSVGIPMPYNVSLELDARSSSGACQERASHASSAALQRTGSAAAPGITPKKDAAAKSSALKALAGVSAIVSKSRKVDAEALQAIKSQRAKARAEGHAAGSLSAASSLPGPAPGGGAGRATPPPAPLACAADPGADLSPFASATSQGLARTPSSSNLPASLGQATSLPIAMHSSQRSQRPSTTPPASAADFEALVCKLTITELVALKQAVEGQLAKQALALAQLQASTQQAQQADMLSQQYAALLLQNAQQAQLVQQLSSQQAAAHAAAIQQALAAAAAAAGIASPSFSPDQLRLLGGSDVHSAGGAGSAGISAYPSMPLPDMSTPFASAPFPPDGGFGGSDVPHAPVSLPQRAFTSGAAPAKPSGGSPRSASTEQHLIGEALHSFLDPERQGPPSRQGSALVNGINWSDRRGLTGSSSGASFARSRSLPHSQDVSHQDPSAPHSQFPGDGADPQLPSLLSSLRLAESLSQQQQQQQHTAGADGGVPATAFAPARSGSLQGPLLRSSAQGLAMGPGSPPGAVFADSMLARTYQPGY
ncbi:hypothetical protein ABPG77_001992 [Micractinium sp. CCAP 211/92]